MLVLSSKEVQAKRSRFCCRIQGSMNYGGEALDKGTGDKDEVCSIDTLVE